MICIANLCHTDQPFLGVAKLQDFPLQALEDNNIIFFHPSFIQTLKVYPLAQHFLII